MNVADLKEFCHTCEGVMSHIYRTHGKPMPRKRMSYILHLRSHVMHADGSCHTNKEVTSHNRMIHVAHMQGSCHTNESCHRYEGVLSQESLARPILCLTHCNTRQHTVTHCNTLQHTPTHCNTLQHTPTHSNALQLTSAY